MAKRKRIYEVRVTKSTAEGYVDIVISANSKKEAIRLALKEAKENTCLYFGDDCGPSYDAEIF